MPKKSQRKNLQTQTNHFYSDYIKKDMLYASLIRSPVKSGTIVSINVPSLPDGYFFFSANDITGKNTINIKETEIDIFCKDKISYKGQAIGLITGPNEDEVKRLVSKTEITIKNLEEDNTEKNKNKEIEIKEENISARRIVKTGIFLKTQKSSEKNFPKENIEVSSIWCYDTVQDLWKEPSGAFCFYEDKNLYIYTPTNIPHFLKHLVATALNIQEDSIIIQKTNNSGHEANGLWRNAILVIQASLASYLTGKAVRLCLSREEHNA
ncbi:MAG: molybdopterin-dependent oxidoreductase, partial [Treponema sp.]|nr:molybdopterin-dependent oxidoreductase [Treponema sp.]